MTYGDLLVILLAGTFGCVLGAVIGLALATWHREPYA